MTIVFFFNDTATTEIYTLSLHDALPISPRRPRAAAGGPPAGGHGGGHQRHRARDPRPRRGRAAGRPGGHRRRTRSEEHTSELQSRQYLVCRLLLEKKTIRTGTLHPLMSI